MAHKSVHAAPVNVFTQSFETPSIAPFLERKENTHNMHVPACRGNRHSSELPRRAGILSGGDMKIALAQINTTPGDFSGNAARIIEYSEKARALGAQIVVFPQMALCGYPLGDLLTRRGFIEAQGKALSEVTQKVTGITAVIGVVHKNPSPEGNPYFNCAIVVSNGEILHNAIKCIIPRGQKYDESVYFQPAAATAQLGVKLEVGRVALCIGDDIAPSLSPREHLYLITDSITNEFKKRRSEVVLNLASYTCSLEGRRKVINDAVSVAQNLKVPVVVANQVGAVDEYVFEGASFAVDKNGQVIARAKSFEEDIIIVDLDYGAGDIHFQDISDVEVIYKAAVAGIADYGRKNGLNGAVVGVSGGIDSSLVLNMAVSAFGKENVTALFLPSRHTSQQTRDDVNKLAANHGIQLKIIEIQPIVDNILASFKSGMQANTTIKVEDNIQSRVRMTLLMGAANSERRLLLATANKSEISTGYCTMYGDFAGGYAPLGDFTKQWVYRVVRECVNAKGEVIPATIINRKPTAELHEGQTDESDVLPFAVIDRIIEGLEAGKSPAEIYGDGVTPENFKKFLKLNRAGAWKRRQGPIYPVLFRKAVRSSEHFPVTSAALE